MRRERRHMNRADQIVAAHGERLREEYGFLADPSLPLWQNVERRIGDYNITDFTSRPRNQACHNLLQHHPLPKGTVRLLGKGLNYCIKPDTILKTTDKTFERLTKDIRRIYTFRDEPPLSDDGYIPSLYIKSDFSFDPADDRIEEALKNFCQAVQHKQRDRQRRRKPRRNITVGEWDLITFLRRHDQYIVIQADKNLGPCILDRDTYIFRAFKEHLGNKRNYRLLTKQQAINHHQLLRYEFDSWRTRHDKVISDYEKDFFRRSRQGKRDRFARFRMTAKVHKSPWKMRPIVCCAGTWMNDWSKWLDYQLRHLKCHVSSFVQDSQQIVEEVRQLRVPPNALLCTMDAQSMYNNIDTEHAIAVLDEWLDHLDATNQLPPLYPLDAIKDAYRLIMRNNLFEFGDTYWLQLLGTAMGTSAAVMWATLYFGYHEERKLLPKYRLSLFYFKRFIDDIFLIWTGTREEWNAYCADLNNFGLLKWDIEELATSVNFLDLTLTIEGDRLTTKTYQKAMNLYLYIPPSSAHPESCIKGTVFGLVLRYYQQNTYRHDFVYFVVLLYRRLLERGWEREYIRGLVRDATASAVARGKNRTLPTKKRVADVSKMIFIHVQYHPDDISRRELRDLYDEHCSELFQEIMGVEPPIIAYSRQRNVGDYVTQAKLHEAPGRTASSIMGEFEAGLDPT